MKTQKIFCISHEPPLIPETLYDFAVGIGDYRPIRGAHIAELDPFWHRIRPLAYGAAGNYAIPRAIGMTIPRPELTGIFSHRKVVVRSLMGRAAARYPVFREISALEAGLIPIEETRPRKDYDFLIGEPILFSDGIANQYAKHHHAVDLADYLSMAVALGIISSNQARALTMETTFIPGGCELGIYPTNWLATTLAKLEAVGREFVTRRADRIRTYDSYQVRAVGFLAERLGSFLLLNELKLRHPHGTPRECLGTLCVIVPDGGKYYGATASELMKSS